MRLLEEASGPLWSPADGTRPSGAAHGKGGSGDWRGGKDERKAGKQEVDVAGRPEAEGSSEAGHQGARRGSEATRLRHWGQGKGP